MRYNLGTVVTTVHAVHALYYALLLASVAAQPISAVTWSADPLLVLGLHVLGLWIARTTPDAATVLSVIAVVVAGEMHEYELELRRAAATNRLVFHAACYVYLASVQLRQ
jgi:hypothetical protein